ncbi:MAG: F0F1 ATP synthase subunit B, partial [Candidatus Eremiobacteraeota bacterium]|nr:F0F1 ATP synthase subunit B [Candidatus Eremiobacteraeota bacterium]
MSGGLFELGPTTVVQVGNFCILLGVLKFVLYDPLKKAIGQRQEKIRDQLDEADSLNARARALKEEYEEKLANARREAAEQYQKIIKEAERIRQERMKSLEEELSRLKEKARQEIEFEKNRTADALKAGAGRLAVEMAEKLLRGHLPQDVQKCLIRDFA